MDAMLNTAYLFLSTHFKDKRPEPWRGYLSQLGSQACAAPELRKCEERVERGRGARVTGERVVSASSCPSCLGK